MLKETFSLLYSSILAITMSSRESLIARQLSGLSFVKSPDVQDEIRQSIMDYFVEDDDSNLSDVELSAILEAGPCTAKVSVQALPQLAADSDDTRHLLDVGHHVNAGDEAYAGLC